MPKIAKSLYLDREVVERPEEYARRRRMNLSNLVNDYLNAITRRQMQSPHGLLVQRLTGAGMPRPARGRGRERPGIQDYRKHLDDKYGRS